MQWYTAQYAVEESMLGWFVGENKRSDHYDGKSYRNVSKASNAMRSFAFIASALATALALACSPSLASAEEDSDAKVEAEYQQLINDALSEYERGSWDESAALFQRAHGLRPSARTLRGLGLAVFEARQYPESIHYLSAALSDTRRPLTPKQREEVEATLNRARLFVGYLKTVVEPSEAHVVINGQEVQPGEGGEVITNLGWLDVEVRADGYDSQTRRLRMNAGEHQVFRARLTPYGQAAPEEARPTIAEAPATAPNHVASVTPSETSAPSSDPANSYGTWKWVTAAGAVVALGVGATMLVIQKSEAPAYTAQCVKSTIPADDCEQRKQRLGGVLWAGSIAGLAVGGGLAVTSVVLFALDAGATRTEHAGLRACRGEGTIGVSCSWAF
jgi:tetratricopeptide (TPR) repeat protein